MWRYGEKFYLLKSYVQWGMVILFNSPLSCFYLALLKHCSQLPNPAPYPAYQSSGKAKKQLIWVFCIDKTLKSWNKLFKESVYSSDVWWRLRQWRKMSAIYVTRIQKWKQQSLILTRFFKFLARLPSTLKSNVYSS